MIVTVAATDVSRCLTTMLHFGTLFILTQDGSRTMSITTGMEGGSSTSLWTSFVISVPHYLFIWDSSHCLSRIFDSCILPTKLEHLAVKQHSSTFLKTEAVKIWSILSHGVFYWLEWGDKSQKLVRLFWPSRQFANMNSPSFLLYEIRSTYGGENRQDKLWKFLEARPCSGMTSTALKLDDKGKTQTRSPSLHCKFSWREPERAILWKSAGVCPLGRCWWAKRVH